MILVTGATGFLGKRVCRQLDTMGLPYTGASLSMGTDLRELPHALDLFERVRPEYVLHCASYVGGIQFGLKHPAELFRNNLLMSINLFEACAKFPIKRLVNPISNCAYPGEATLFQEDKFWDGALHDSVLMYGMARKMSYVGALAYQRQYGVDTINLIFSNMYGPDDHFEAERSHALGALIMKIVAAKEANTPAVEVWGTGNPVREWLHVDDGAQALIHAMKIAPYSGIINVGVAKGISIRDMAKSIQKIVGYEGELIFDPSKLDGAPYKTVDGALGTELLQWSPQIPFSEGLKDTISWYLKNKAN